MLTSLGYRMEDSGHTDFISAQKLVALNDAQRQVVALCSNEALAGIQVSTDMGSATADTDLGSLLYFALPVGTIVLTDVTATAAVPTVFTKTSHGLIDGDVVKLHTFTQMTEINGMTGTVNQLNSSTFEVNSISGTPAETSINTNLGGTVEKLESSFVRIVKVYDDTNNRFIEMVSPNGFETNTTYSYGTLGTLMRNRLYVSTGDTTVAECTLIYITSPNNIAATDTEITNLSDSIQQAIIEMAESLLWRQDNRQQRAQGASSNAIAMITAINTST